MKKIKFILIYFLMAFIIIMSVSSCTQQAPKKPAPTSDEPKEMPKVVEEIESEIINIMSEVDMIPYYEKQIQEKLKKNKEKKELSIKMGMTSQSDSSQSQEGNGQQEGTEKKEAGEIDKLVEFEPKPITINDILLSEILESETQKIKGSNTQEIPNHIDFIWDKINKKIRELHKKWNSLESDVIKSGVSQEPVMGFEKTLNNLTISANNYNFLDTLVYSNKLTSYIPDLVENFKKKFPTPIYYMKYYLRQTVLACKIKDYNSASSNYSKLNIYKDALVSQLVDKKLTELANKLNTSIKDLEDSLLLKDLNVIKIKASVVMSNIQLVKEELSKQ